MEQTLEGSQSKFSEENLQAEEKISDERPFCFKFATVITKVWAVLTLIGLWYCAVSLIHQSLSSHASYRYTHYYVLAITLAVTIFELIWLVDKCMCCKDDGNCCCTVWRIFLWVDNWKKGILYIAISIPTFTSGYIALLPFVSGTLVIVLGILYILKTIGESDCVQNKKQTRTKYVPMNSSQSNLVENEVKPGVNEQPNILEENETEKEDFQIYDMNGQNPFEEEQQIDKENKNVESVEK